MNKYNNYKEAEEFLIRKVVLNPNTITKHTFELICTGFILTDPSNNKNSRSNYVYADAFFRWLLTGEKELNTRLLELNPWVKRFVDSENLPPNFSTSYGWKIKHELPVILLELNKFRESRRAYININVPDDKVILYTKTTHEFPCTIGIHLFIREDALHMVVNMRSNNIYSVMPYDVYNFTELLMYIAGLLKIDVGYYYHQINNAHMYKGDIRRVKESFFKIKT